MSSFSLESIADFLAPINIFEISSDEGFRETQQGKHILCNTESLPDITHADLIILGCGDSRGAFEAKIDDETPNSIRTEFYNLYKWHDDVQVADLGNVKSGFTLQDTYAALCAILKELIPLGKKIVILGGSHDLTAAQYDAYAASQKIIHISNIDARIDLDMDSALPVDNFLLPIFTQEPNFIKSYNHIGFQSYLVHPGMLETIDKLRFDCYRVGKIKDNIEAMEPVIRYSDMVSFDIAAIQNAHAPANHITPNGFNGEEACTLMQYAGFSNKVSTIGIYGLKKERDLHNLTSKQMAHMLWYIMDGIHQSKEEATIDEREHFMEYHVRFAEIESTFLQSKITGKWWMDVPEIGFIPCSKEDYLIAAKNDIPERWLRTIERN
ncbi:arginase family protein [Rhizosphaericola mali]|uniref:Arginase n=1 Tax=Rhizosphaericola mali TaxID=2545455 RepID=A0A5P2FZB3_9BACT|nr:arginase family protein [Rhizosphaericola mali]QES87738.1 arginase [Rhizosphaericola mali]